MRSQVLRISGRVVRLLGAAYLAGCSASPTENQPRPRTISFSPQAKLADTIDAILPAPIDFTVIGADGKPAAGVDVVLDGVDRSVLSPDLFVSSTFGIPNYQYQVKVTTDDRGTASVFVRLGTRATVAHLFAGVESLGLHDSLAVVVKPGAPARITIAPADTAVLAGGSYVLAAGVVDRVFNHRADTVTFTVTRGPIAVDQAGRVTSASTGRGRVLASAGRLLDSAFVSVIPDGLIAGLAFGVAPARLVVFRTDGTLLHTVATVSTPQPNPPEFGPWPTWIRGTSDLLYIDDGALKRVDAGGTIRSLFSGTPSPFNYHPAEMTADGSWVYFTRGTWAVEASLWRVRVDGTELTRIADTTGSQAYQGGTALNPAGDHLIYQTGPYFSARLRNLDLTSGVSVDINAAGAWPAWSPDGQWIAYLSNDRDVKVIHPDGTGDHIVVRTAGIAPGFSWSDDGRWLLATGLIQVSPYFQPVFVDLLTGDVLPVPAVHPGFGGDIYQMSLKLP